MDNRKDITNRNINPYHNYSDVDAVRLKMAITYEQVNSTDEKGNFLFEPTGIDAHTRKFNPYHYTKTYWVPICRDKYEMATYIVKRGKDKGKEKTYPKNLVYIPTTYEDGELEAKPYKSKIKAKVCKNGKVRKRTKDNPTLVNGEWVYEGINAKRKKITNDIQVLYKICEDYRQVPAGLTRNERNVVVCDFDTKFSEELWREIVDKIKDNHIPMFSYIEIHFDKKEKEEDENHFQIGWILDEPFNYRSNNCYEYAFVDFSEKELYLKMIKGLASLLGSDKAFTGFNIKNPCCVRNTQTYWFNDVVSKRELTEAFMVLYHKDNPTLVDGEKENTFSDNHSTITSIPTTKPMVSKKDRSKDNLTDKERSSRHCYLMKFLREGLWAYRRDNGEFPPLKDVYDMAMEIEKQGLDVNHKSSTRNSATIKYDADKILEFCEKKYVKFDNKERSEYGHLSQSCYKQIRLIEAKHMKLQGKKVKEIAKELGTSEKSIRNYLKEDVDIEAMNKMKESVLSFNVTQRTEKMQKYIDDITNALSLYEEICSMENVAKAA
ncbi:MAG: hypothetical protein PUC01_05260 [Spirochaetales bacterium]|nr:hypothetical protein [Spirochaetales bacterium]